MFCKIEDLLTFEKRDIKLGFVEAEEVFVQLLLHLIIYFTRKDHFY